MIRLVLLNSFIKKGNSKINQKIFAKEIRQIVINDEYLLNFHIDIIEDMFLSL
jgi:hypothetical protein